MPPGGAGGGTWTGCHFWVVAGCRGPSAPPGDHLAAAPPLDFSASAITEAACRSALLKGAEPVAAGQDGQVHEFWMGRCARTALLVGELHVRMIF